MQIFKREVRNPDFLLSLFSVGSLSLTIFINLQKIKKFDVTKIRKCQIFINLQKIKKFDVTKIRKCQIRSKFLKKFEIVQTRILEKYSV
jgi:hypothetical protein